MDNTSVAAEYLAATWKYVPDDPILIGGVPISCPSCGSAEGIRFWLYPDEGQVTAEHTCVPFSFGGPDSKIRRWSEPRISPDDLRSVGQDMYTATRTATRDLARTLRTALLPTTPS
jgi:hypothetical protein